MTEFEKSFPFDAVEGVDGTPDRIFYAEDFANYFKQFIGNGIYPNPSTNLQVQSINNNMVLTVQSGSAFINGYGYINNEPLEVMVSTANSAYARIDIIVLQLSYIDREIKVVYKEGVPKSNPIKPELVRNDDVYELQLAVINVKSGATAITQADITDTRLDTKVCGVVTAVVDSVDTEELYTQYETYLNSKIAEWNETKAQQTIDFNNQMTAQQEEFNTQHNEIDAWYASVKANIAKLQTFNFENIAELPGTNKSTVPQSDGSMLEVIKITGTEKKVAEQLTSFPENGDIIANLKIYDEDGVSILRESTITTIFNEDGSISEVVI